MTSLFRPQALAHRHAIQGHDPTPRHITTGVVIAAGLTVILLLLVGAWLAHFQILGEQSSLLDWLMDRLSRTTA